ncbi:MAG: homocysteine S-methyltransferase family protein [Longibaculum sp.]
MLDYHVYIMVKLVIMTSDEYALGMIDYMQGVSIVGGCCGTTPDFIAELKKSTTKCHFKRCQTFDSCFKSKQTVILRSGCCLWRTFKSNWEKEIKSSFKRRTL